MKTSKLDELESLLSMRLKSLADPYYGSTAGLEGVSGVYVLSFDRGRYLYVGKSKDLQRRLHFHVERNEIQREYDSGLSRKYTSITNQHSLSSVFVVDHAVSSPEILSSRESMWIGIVHKAVGSKRIANVMFSGSESRKKMNLSPEERASRAARMSHTIRSLHKDPAYKAKMKQIAKENYSKVDPSVREVANSRISSALKAVYADPKERERMAAKVKKQWEDPEFRRINSDRIKQVLEKHRTGEKPLRRKLYLMEVTLPLQSSSSSLQRKFLVRPAFIIGLLTLPSTSDRSPEKKLPSLLQNAVSIVRKDPLDWQAGQRLQPRVGADEKALAEHPFIRYVQAYRKQTGSYRTKPCLLEDSKGNLLRKLSHRKADLAGQGLKHVKDYQNLWAFWEDQKKYPLMK